MKKSFHIQGWWMGPVSGTHPSISIEFIVPNRGLIYGDGVRAFAKEELLTVYFNTGNKKATSKRWPLCMNVIFTISIHARRIERTRLQSLLAIGIHEITRYQPACQAFSQHILHSVHSIAFCTSFPLKTRKMMAIWIILLPGHGACARTE